MGLIDNSINSLNDVNDDSMDPNDPNSIMYDPSLAEENGTVNVTSNGQIIVTPPTADGYSDPTGSSSKDDDILRKLRRFGKL